jgi:DNA invertase Pin-like site-specific DNA recombinase
MLSRFEAQMAALKAAGCERLYAEKRSGAEIDRKALAKLMKEASPGDTVVVTWLDRLARSTCSTGSAVSVVRDFGTGGGLI